MSTDSYHIQKSVECPHCHWSIELNLEVAYLVESNWHEAFPYKTEQECPECESTMKVVVTADPDRSFPQFGSFDATVEVPDE